MASILTPDGALRLLRAHWPLVVLLLSVAALRVTLLVTSQYSPHSDEAVIGLMAKRILAGQEFPIFYQGQPYNGGGAIEAYLGALVFSVFGPSSIALKSVILVLSLCLLVLVYTFALRFLDRGIAFVATALLSVAPSLTKWSFQVRGGYIETLCLIPIISFFFWRIFREEQPRRSDSCLLGFFIGLAYWNSELILSLVLTCALFAFIKNKLFLLHRQVLLVAAGAVIGASPTIYFNLTRQGANLRDLLNRLRGPASAVDGPGFVDVLGSFVLEEMPRFFGVHTVWWYRFDEPPSLVAIGHFLMFWIVVLGCVVSQRHSFKKIVTGALDFSTRRLADSRAIHVTSFMCVFIGVHLVLILRNPIRVPSYVLPIVPFTAILTAQLLLRAGRDRGRKIVVATILGALFLGGFYVNVSLIGHGEVETLPTNAEGKMANFRGHPDSMRHVIEFLNERDIRFVYGPYWVKGRLIFESNETILVSSLGLWRHSRFPEYEEIVERERTRYCFVIESHSHLIERVSQLLEDRGVRYAEHRVDEFTIFVESDPQDS